LIDTILKVQFIDFQNTNWHNQEFEKLLSKEVNSKKRHFDVAFSDERRDIFFERDEKGKIIEKEVQNEAYYTMYRIGQTNEGYPIIKRGYLYSPSMKLLTAFNFTSNNQVTYKAKKVNNGISFEDFVEFSKSSSGFRKKDDRLFGGLQLPMSYLFMNAHQTYFHVPESVVTKMFSPIRSLPKSTYYRSRISKYSPSGEHVPNSLATNFTSKKNLLNRLNSFGKNSGLFECIEIHNLSSSKSSQFNVNIKIDGVTSSIDQVGTGVGQVLPIVSELISLKSACLFLVQQPELHLHPKAQSELGVFLFDELNINNDLSMIMETHSEYMIDSFRRRVAITGDTLCSLFFFSNSEGHKIVNEIAIDKNGHYSGNNLSVFREFYLKESIKNLDL